jgi:hypothetical protein
MFKNQKNFPFFEKNSDSKKRRLQFFRKLQRTASSPEGISGFHEKTSGFVNGYLILSIVRTMVIYQPGYLILENHGYGP